ncbi:hypothetical protein PR202_ga22874 [Eleusine coracana subsp. coracana]|uniref:Uncharacterized protein n=1 Tax=Eleusine coracana subsp. coracana TaxID=191504 RepID=A0AAV5D3R2_ELECO|nr:hypothetical protein PR202_ga22874 [Eleusine coracana subsp. coracana]
MQRISGATGAPGSAAGLGRWGVEVGGGTEDDARLLGRQGQGRSGDEAELLARQEEVMAYFFILIWRARHARNSVTQAGERISIEGLVVFLTNYVESLQRSRSPGDEVGKGNQNSQTGTRAKSTVYNSDSDLRWVPPKAGVLKINVDAAFDHESGMPRKLRLLRVSMGFSWRSVGLTAP